MININHISFCLDTLKGIIEEPAVNSLRLVTLRATKTFINLY